MTNETFTYDNLADIEAQARALRAEATFNMTKAAVAFIRRQFSAPKTAARSAV